MPLLLLYVVVFFSCGAAFSSLHPGKPRQTAPHVSVAASQTTQCCMELTVFTKTLLIVAVLHSYVFLYSYYGTAFFKSNTLNPLDKNCGLNAKKDAFSSKDTFRHCILVTVTLSLLSNLFYLFIHQREKSLFLLFFRFFHCGPSHFRDPNIAVSL